MEGRGGTIPTATGRSLVRMRDGEGEDQQFQEVYANNAVTLSSLEISTSIRCELSVRCP